MPLQSYLLADDSSGITNSGPLTVTDDDDQLFSSEVLVIASMLIPAGKALLASTLTGSNSRAF